MSTKCVISFDECKPHWAVQQGLDKEAAALGMKDVQVGGDFDTKIALIYGTVEDFGAFAKAIAASRLQHGTLSEVSA